MALLHRVGSGSPLSAPSYRPRVVSASTMSTCCAPIRWRARSAQFRPIRRIALSASDLTRMFLEKLLHDHSHRVALRNHFFEAQVLTDSTRVVVHVLLEPVGAGDHGRLRPGREIGKALRDGRCVLLTDIEYPAALFVNRCERDGGRDVVDVAVRPSPRWMVSEP